jgi:hypothetical protein
MNTVFILNDAPYGTERSYNGLRLARALSKEPDQIVRVFLMGMRWLALSPVKRFRPVTTTRAIWFAWSGERLVCAARAWTLVG